MEEGRFYGDIEHTQNRQTDAELTKYLLDLEAYIALKLNYYRGEAEINGKLVKVGERILSEEGIQYVNRQFRHFMHKGGALANLTAKQVSTLILQYGSRVRVNMLHNLLAYGIGSVSVVNEVKNDVVEVAFLNLTRSIDDLERKRIMDSRKIVESHQYTPEQQKVKSW